MAHFVLVLRSVVLCNTSFVYVICNMSNTNCDGKKKLQFFGGQEYSDLDKLWKNPT